MHHGRVIIFVKLIDVRDTSYLMEDNHRVISGWTGSPPPPLVCVCNGYRELLFTHGERRRKGAGGEKKRPRDVEEKY